MRALAFTALLFALLVAASVAPGQPLAADEGSVEYPVLQDRLNALMQAVTAGDESTLLGLLREAAADPQLAALERDQLLVALIDELRGMTPGSVGNKVLEYLAEYQPQALVPHEENPIVPVPVHNIRAATAGLEHTWRRQESAYAGAVLLAQDPAALVQAYRLHDELPVRHGLLMALNGASNGQLEMIGFLALNEMQQAPELATLAGEAALQLGDTRALEQLLRTGSGSAVTTVLRKARQTLDQDQLDRLLDTAVNEAQPEVAAVAIAELSPALNGREGNEDRLFELLGDEQLGSTAALALAASPSDTTILRLGELLERPQPSSLAAKRARLALELMQLRSDEALQP